MVNSHAKKIMPALGVCFRRHSRALAATLAGRRFAGENHVTCTANPPWGDIFESSKLEARTSLLPRFDEKRLSSFEL